MATVKSKIYSQQTNLFLQILAVKRVEGDCSLSEIINSFSSKRTIISSPAVILDAKDRQD